MGRINVLPFAVANLIAAGEVVDRPASVVKELMENAVDAGADRVTIEIQNGGVTFLRVSDNGCGMTADELPIAIRRHATSKIKVAADLDGIQTLGFRGEALAAIASVSDMRIISKTADAQYGAVLEAHGGEIVGVREQGCSTGTTIIVENLFANVPARRKFLKKDVTESMAVTVNVEKLALSNPKIAFHLIIDGHSKLETAGDGNLQHTIYAVFGKEFAARLIEVQSENDGIEVKGYIGRSDNFKANRSYQNFFINGRYVKSKTVMAALEQAYTSYMPPEKFPCCVLYVQINPARVDVNVHPAKLEVKFSNEKAVFEAVYYTVRTALENNATRPSVNLNFSTRPAKRGYGSGTFLGRLSDSAVPVTEKRAVYDPDGRMQPQPQYRRAAEQDFLAAQTTSGEPYAATTARTERETALQDPFVPAVPPSSGSTAVNNESAEKRTEETVAATMHCGDDRLQHRNVESPVAEPSSAVTRAETQQPVALSPDPVTEREDVVERTVLPSSGEPLSTATEEAVSPTAEVTEATSITRTWRIVGEVFRSYVLVECEDKLLVVDQHAAHERILFEQLKAGLQRTEVCSQLLMLPIEVMMTSGEVEALRDYAEELRQVGFTLRFARNTVSVDAIPEGIESQAVADMLQTMAGRILNATGSVKLTRDIVFEKALYQAACKAAVKAGRRYAEEHIEWIIAKLMEIPSITFCPHGRPVAMEISHHALDKQFDRLGF